MTAPTPGLAPRPVELDGATLGVLDIGAEESERFLDLLAARLDKRHFLAAIVRVTKPSDRQPCPVELIEQLADRCDVVVTGAGRSGEAAAASALDAAALERLSVPCAVVIAADTSDPVDAHALVEANFRAVERALTSAEPTPPTPEHRASPARNGEVTCEC